MCARQSLDYIFECFYDEDESIRKKKKLVIDKKIGLEKFLMKDLILCEDSLNTNDRKYTQLSDHYGLSCTIVFNGN